MRKNQKIILSTLLIVNTFLLGTVTGAIWYRQWIFPVPQFFRMKQIINQLNNIRYSRSMADSNSTKTQSKAIVSIPVKYLPKYRIITEADNNYRLINEEGLDTFTVSSRELALVLVDIWNYEDPKEGGEPSEYLKNLIALLDKCREYGVIVIHAPNRPVVDKYPQYHSLKKSVQKFMSNYPQKDQIFPYLTWPPQDNDIYIKIQELRSKGRNPAYKVRPIIKRDISRFLKPTKNEYVLYSHDEFRYVLWKEKIKILLYAGSALNECMLHRDTGINLLAGIDRKRTAFMIVVLEDCSSAMGGLQFDNEVTKQVILDYYKSKIAFVSNSKDLKFKKF